MSNKYDAIVIGGGPGGSMASTLLAKEGHKVLLIEREKFPRYHIGESLLSGTADLLKRINVLDKLEEADYVKKHGVTWIWGKTREPWTVYFKDALAVPYDYGYQVERAPFDKMLLDNAREHGVEVLELHRVSGLKLDNDRVVGVEYESVETKESFSAEASWTIDASGQSGFITKQFNKRKWDENLKNMAIWSYWKNATRPEGIDEGNTFLPTFSEGWWWFIPLRNNITSIGAVLSNENYGVAQKQGLEEFYLDAIQRTPELAERLKSANMVEQVRVIKDWSYAYESFVGKGFVAVGDAACFIDPLLSTGVHMAMFSGFIAAVTLNTLLSDSTQNEEKVLNFYQEHYSHEYQRMKDQIYFLYGGHSSPDSYFWHARNTLDIPNAKPEEAFVTLIAGAYEHKSWYRRFLNNLEAPAHLKKIFEGIFDETNLGVKMFDLNTPLAINNEGWEIKETFAIDGLALRPSKVISFGNGTSMPFTENLSKVLNKVNGNTTSKQLLDSLSNGNVNSRNSIQTALNEAIAYGLLVSA